MKKILLIALSSALMFSACKTLEHIDGYQSLSGIDFRPYAEKGFLITPHEYYGEYLSIYMVNYTIMPEANDEKTGVSGGADTHEWVTGYVDVKTALDSIYNICISMGADALMEFNIGVTSDVYSGIQNPTTVFGMEITGIAIKRED
ncbi:MAG: hypothetical protein JRJ00_14690 [Deltaproteobacteria bacterium]|nr:hypothetical protein [Deltaproteobacteria bacterium]